MAWKPSDPERFLRMYLCGATYNELYHTFGGTFDKNKDYVRKLIRDGVVPNKNEPTETGLDNGGLKSYTDYWQLTSRSGYMIATDFHAPFYSQLWFDRMLQVAKMRGLTELIIPGDGLDMHAFSGWGADPECPWSKELIGSANFLWVLYHSFERIYWTKGNHEARLGRTTDNQLGFDGIMNSILCKYSQLNGLPFEFKPERMITSPYTHLIIDDEWLVVHPASYRMLPLSVANRMAMVENKHVISAHSHKANKGHADNGRVIIDTGGMFNEDLIDYRHMRMTVHGKWANGFVVYQGGVADLYSDYPFTNWDRIDKGYA